MGFTSTRPNKTLIVNGVTESPNSAACPAAKAFPFPCSSFGWARSGLTISGRLNHRTASWYYSRSQNGRRKEIMPGIHSSRVVLIEGKSDELLPNTESAVGMHGLAIMVPPGAGGDWLLDIVWRIAMAYAAMPSLLYSRANVRTMVEAVMSHQSRPIESAKTKPARPSRVKVRRVPG